MDQEIPLRELKARVQELEHLERNYRLIIENATDMISIHDAEGVYQYASSASVTLMGRSPEELIGRDVYDFIHPDDLGAVQESHRKIISADVIYTVSFRLRHKEGHYVWVESISKTIRHIHSNQIEEIIVTTRDISDRKKSQEENESQNRLIGTLLDNLQVGIFMAEAPSGKPLLVNRRAMELLGRGIMNGADKSTLAEVYQAYKYKTGEVYPEAELPIVRALNGKRHSIDDMMVVKPTQEKIFLEVFGSPVRDKDGNVIAGLVSFSDITKRKLAEEALENRILALTQPLEGNERISFEEMFNLEEIQKLQDDFARATGVASIITQTDGTPITKPSNFCRLCKDIIRKTQKGLANCFHSDAVIGRYNPEGPIISPCMSGGLWDAGAGITVGGRHVANWLIGQVRDDTQSPEMMRRYAREIGADETIVVEAFEEVPSMSREQFSLVSKALFTLARQLSDKAYQNVQQARFITQLKQAEQEKARMDEQFFQIQKMESIGRLAGGVAHDFNNMLSIILGHTEMALDQVENFDPLFAGLKEIQAAAERSASLTRQLLAFARKQTVSPKILDLNQVLEGMLSMLHRLIGEDIDLEWIPGSGLWPVKVDSSQLDQVLANLCVNSRDAINGIGKVTIETGNITFDEVYCCRHRGFIPGDYAMIAVSDTGYGINKENMEHLFEPFFTTKGIGRGTGLGLATVYGIVKQNRGFVNVYSEPKEGTTFRIYFPRHMEKPLPLYREDRDKSPAAGNETVLLVEDEPAILQMTTLMLNRLGYTVLAAARPSKAIQLAKTYEKTIHLLITDVVMPEMNGKELGKKILEIYQDLKCLYMYV